LYHRTLISFVFCIAGMRSNIPFAIALFCLIFLFAFLAAADFAIPSATTPADLEHIGLLIKIAGGFGLVTSIMGWYLAIELSCASTGIPFPLPSFDLSSKLFANTKAAAIERGTTEVV